MSRPRAAPRYIRWKNGAWFGHWRYVDPDGTVHWASPRSPYTDRKMDERRAAIWAGEQRAKWIREHEAGKTDWLRLREEELAWVYFFDALRVEAKEAFHELLEIATLGGAWMASFFPGPSEVEPHQVSVHGLEPNDAPLFSKQLPAQHGWGITFVGHEEPSRFEEVAKRVILWEQQHQMIDLLDRPHPRAFVCAMNLIGAKNGEFRAGWELIVPTTLPRQLIGYTELERFEAVLDEPPPSLENGESLGAFHNRIHNALDHHIDVYLRRLWESGRMESRVFPKRVLRHFNWLVRYQVCGESAPAIAGTAGGNVGVSTVQEAIDSTAKLLRLKKREGRGGRPRGTPDQARRYIVRRPRVKKLSTEKPTG